MRTLQREMDGRDVTAWQEFLIGRGLLEAGNATGHFGPKTEEATKHYQATRGLQADGVVGPKTLAAAQGDGFAEPAAPAFSGALAEVHPELARRVEQLLNEAAARNIVSVITDGYRSFEEQTALFAKGRPNNGPIVTNARAGESYHNYGLAVDIASRRGGKTVWTEDDARIRGPIGQQLGLEWGGAWKKFVDLPHFQLTAGLPVEECLKIYNQNGNDIKAVWAEIDRRLGARDLFEPGDEVE